MIKFFATTLAISVLAAGCFDNSASTKAPTKEKAMEILTEEQKKDGWELLFDGKTMNGWHKYGGDSVGKAWKVADGTFYLDTTERVDWQIKGGGDIVTDSSFENFHLKLEWKIAKDGNSGIMFYVHEDSAKYKWA